MQRKRTFHLLSYILVTALLAAAAAMPPAASAPIYATVYGQVTLDDQPVNGATVTCNGNSTTTSASIYNGFYTFSLPIGKDYPVKATYTNGNKSYEVSDSIDLTDPNLTSTSSKTIPLNPMELKLVSSATVTPVPNASVTPTPNATATPTPTPNATATATPSATPKPTSAPTARPVSYTAPTAMPTMTPAPTAIIDHALNTTTPERKVFSSPRWENDHETIIVSNVGGAPILVRSWIGSPANNVTVEIGANATKMVLTPSIMSQNNQVVDVGYDAYENGALIDTYKATIAMVPTATPAPTRAQSPGFAGIAALLCIAGAAYLLAKKEG